MRRGSTNEEVVTYTANGAVTAYRFVVETGSGEAKQVDAVGGLASGIAQHTVADGDTGCVYHKNGEGLPVEAGAATTNGGLAMSDASGRAIDYAAAAGRYAIGRFRMAAGAAGDIVEIQWLGALQ